jgi:hypothetical protein
LLPRNEQIQLLSELEELETQIKSKLYKILGTTSAVDTSFEIIDAVDVTPEKE